MGVAFGTQSDMFGTVSRDGSVRVWDLHEYSILAQNSEKCEGKCISFSGNVAVVTGWKDGFIRSYDTASGLKNWEIANAHKGEVTSITDSLSAGAIVSGGEDGYVRVWHGTNRSMLADFG